MGDTELIKKGSTMMKKMKKKNAVKKHVKAHATFSIHLSLSLSPSRCLKYVVILLFPAFDVTSSRCETVGLSYISSYIDSRDSCT